jgi:hypothetical protein
MQCETCGASVALLIFADDAIDRGGLEDYARLMYPKIVELNVPTWVIGPTIGSDPPPERPVALDADLIGADILKIWPERESICRLRPDEFRRIEPLISIKLNPAEINPIIEELATTHCG